MLRLWVDALSARRWKALSLYRERRWPTKRRRQSLLPANPPLPLLEDPPRLCGSAWQRASRSRRRRRRAGRVEYAAHESAGHRDLDRSRQHCPLARRRIVLRRVCPAGIAHSETLLPLIRRRCTKPGWLCRPARDRLCCRSRLFYRSAGRLRRRAGSGFCPQLPVIPVGTLEAMALASGGEQVSWCSTRAWVRSITAGFQGPYHSARWWSASHRPCRFPTRLVGWLAVMASPPIPCCVRGWPAAYTDGNPN
jgi:hypothetical protein